ncbi:DNA-directed RNA polymerase II subunit GRINL1A [Eumeta japonica]|uniref:DNA-directed RNA polymerase II subunit GRINL1A n=1 Tax=Eumeta variegata TaxID=151549 RepID=A0A4C1VRE2_EUMVA|nr:DNA-directed RNA polymerase II subunit GRINL1A [Eumeta japonica]
MKKIHTKIPGTLPILPKSELDGKVTDLSSKTITELLELRDRQRKLLSHKFFISKLPDKGAKIQTFLDKINNELNAKQEEEHTCKLLSNLKLDKKSIQNIEWETNITKNNKDTYLDSDDDSEPEDVFRILSQSTSNERKVKILPPEKSLITASDLENVTEVPHVQFIVEKTEHKPEPKISGQFKPYKTTKNNVHDPKKEILRKKHKNWEITAATPPPIIHGPSKVLSLQESLILQKEYNIHIKEIEAQHAAEKLLSKSGVKMTQLPEDVSVFGNYRQISNEHSEESDDEGSEKEVHDEEPERGGVVFTVMR